MGYERFKKEWLQLIFFLPDSSNILGQVTVTYWAKFNTNFFLFVGVIWGISLITPAKNCRF